MVQQHSLRLSDARAGFEAAIQGLATSIGPLLLFQAMFGEVALEAGYWAVLITASAVHGVNLALRGHWAVIPSSRVASLAAYTALILQLANASGPHISAGSHLSLEQLRIGLAAGSLLFLAASMLVVIAGLFKLGNLLKMIPTPVTSGISNGTALLMIWLALKQFGITGTASAVAGFSMLGAYLYWPRLQLKFNRIRGIPAVAIAILLGLAITSLTEGLSTPSNLGVSTFPVHWFSFLMWPDLLPLEWGRLMSVGVPGAMTLALVMILETFTATGVMETRFGVQVDPNRELVVLGGTNVFSAVVGGVPCTGSPVRSIASWIHGGRSRMAGCFCLLTATVMIITLGPWLLALPAGIIAGLFLIQATMLADPVFLAQAREMLKSFRSEGNTSADLGFWIALAISMVAFFGNLIWACFMGIALSCLLVLRRVSHNLTAHWAYLDQYRSRRVRSDGESATLRRLFRRVGVLRLTGHLFFGNSVRLTQLVGELHPDASAVVVDVSQVTDADPSGLDAVAFVLRALSQRSIPVVVTGVRKTSANELRKKMLVSTGIDLRVDLDRGLEYCEDLVLLNATTVSGSLLSKPFEDNALLTGLTQEEITTVLMLGDLHEVKKGSPLFFKGAASDGVWMLESGMVSILAQGDDSDSRLSTFGPGQFVGEMGFIDGKTRSATAQADTPVRALRLNHQAATALVEQHPLAAIKITRNIARELSLRVRNSTALFLDETSEESTVWANSSLSTLSRY